MKHVLKKYPIISYGIIILIVNLVFSAFGFDYDASGVITILTFSLPILGFPYWFVREILTGLNDGKSFFGIEIYSIVLGLIIFILLEWGYQWLRKKFKTNK